MTKPRVRRAGARRRFTPESKSANSEMMVQSKVTRAHPSADAGPLRRNRNRDLGRLHAFFTWQHVAPGTQLNIVMARCNLETASGYGLRRHGNRMFGDGASAVHAELRSACLSVK
jgi:hypothetical protein